MSDVWPMKFTNRGRKMIMLLAVIVIASLVTGFVWSYKSVHVLADGKNIKINTIHSKPEDVLSQAGIALGAKDEYRLSTAKLANGSVLEVFRAVPVNVTYRGRTEVVVTGKPTVREVAESLGIPAANLKSAPDGAQRVTQGMDIRVAYIETKERMEDQTIPFPIVHQPDPTLEKGTEELAEEGKNGKKSVRLAATLEDGKEVSAVSLAETVIEPPKPQVVRVGTRDIVQTSRGAVRFDRVEIMEATAYHPNDGSTLGITATGIKARYGVVAVDPDVIPLGKRVFVPGYGQAVAADVGGAIVGNRIDLCMEDFDEAWDFGRRMVKVYVLSD